VFYYADEFDVSWLPSLRALWGPQGQQIMIPTPRQPYKRYGLGAVNYHTGETAVLFRRRKRRREVAELLQVLRDKHLTGTIYVAWDKQTPIRTMRSKLSCVARRDGSCYCTCLPTAHGSIPSKCCGGTSGAK
jgi:hypothetical protein